MRGAVFAEASPCCPSPMLGQLVIAAYIIGGAVVYLWLFSVFVRWAHARYRSHGPGSEPKRTVGGAPEG